MTSRPLRADARQNEARLLSVAAQVFATAGADTSSKAIAQAAGVGIGTLYRRFPTREHLVEAVYRNESARLCAAAGELLARSSPLTALRTWMGLFVDYMLTKNGMADALQVVLSTGGDLRMQTRDLLTEALTGLISAGRQDGSIRAGLDPGDVLMALGGVTLIAAHEAQRDLAGRLLDLLLNGVRNDRGIL